MNGGKHHFCTHYRLRMGKNNACGWYFSWRSLLMVRVRPPSSKIGPKQICDGKISTGTRFFSPPCWRTTVPSSRVEIRNGRIPHVVFEFGAQAILRSAPGGFGPREAPGGSREPLGCTREAPRGASGEASRDASREAHARLPGCFRGLPGCLREAPGRASIQKSFVLLSVVF